MQNFIKTIKKIEKFLNRQVFEIVGNEAVSHYKQSFTDEGFTDTGKQKWQEVKRRTNPRNFRTITRGKRKGVSVAKKKSFTKGILVQTGELKDSIVYKRGDGRSVIISSDKVYAEVHNKGLRAGRGKGFRMPKRQFIGKSAELNKKISNKIKLYLDKITQQQ
jgi:phage gpG-like protein